jgi:hypothetical protein
MINFRHAIGIVIIQKLEESAKAGMDPYGLHTDIAQEAANYLRGLLEDYQAVKTASYADAERIADLRKALTTIARHDIQAIAIDALNPGERLPITLKERKKNP